MIRRATLEDIPELLGLAFQFYEESHWRGLVAFDADVFTATLSEWISSDDVAVFMSSGGFIGIRASSIYFSSDRVAMEIGFHAPDGSGNALRSAAENWAKSRAKVVLMGSHEPDRRSLAISRWYRMAGYMPFAHEFAKAL